MKNNAKKMKTLGLIFLILSLSACKSKTSELEKNSPEVINNIEITESAGEPLELEEARNPGETHVAQKNESMELSYATQFSVTKYENGYSYIQIADGNEYLLVPKGEPDNKLGHTEATIIHVPCTSIYQASTSGMDLIRALDSLSQVTACSTDAKDYSMEEVSQAISSGAISYVGKYKAPDYELLLSLDTDIAIESTMIYHSPKVKEQLEHLSIPVLVERSSYEEDPLGRLEWIKLYGLLLGKEKEATAFFDNEIQKVSQAISQLNNSENKKTVAFFYVTSNGYVNVRKPNDYISKMIEMTGGQYALNSLIIEEENALSTVNLSWEDFYAYGKEADILIYNSTIDGGIHTYNELLEKNALFADFKAVQEGTVFCTSKNMFQESSMLADIIVELSYVLNGKIENCKYILPLS